MKNPLHVIAAAAAAVTCLVATMVGAPSSTPPRLDEQLQPLQPLLGKTWRGEFKDSTLEKPKVDVVRWERALNGKAVRVMHSVNDGIYGGETIIHWDSAKEKLIYHYFTTAGFNTTGIMTLKEGVINTHEVVNGGAGGVTEVKGASTLRPDGTFHSKSEYLKNGEWIAGHEIVYREDAKAEVRFN